MKAAVCYEFGKPLVVEAVEIDPPQVGEVKVRMTATAICHSDIHILGGEWGGNPPIVPGHEGAGVVETVGKGVAMVKSGDHVVVSLLRSCGRCFYCTTGSPYICDGDFALDRESRIHTRLNEPIQPALRTGALAEYAVVDQSQVVPIPNEMPLDRAALLACGVITGFGAVVNTAQVEPNSSVVVIGAGGVGLNTVQGAVLTGAHPIVAIDLLDSKLAAAQAFGATHTINATQINSPEDAIKELTAGRGADYVFVTVGSPEAIVQGFKLIRREGTVVVVGVPGIKSTASLPAANFVLGGPRKIVGSFMGSTRLSVDVPRLAALYQQGRLKLDELITSMRPGIELPSLATAEKDEPDEASPESSE